ncbi:MAG: hypothetical protein IH614_15810 [Desulfuromonadales bacterium]|nr:hypothetical protein [Desulfuromonadales bacterium]
MNTRPYRTAAVVAALALLSPLGSPDADAGIVSYTSPKHVFSINDVMCDKNVFGTACLSPTANRNAKDGLPYYGIDNAYGFQVQNFASPVSLPMDGVYDNGQIRNVPDEFGNGKGVATITQVTPRFLSGPLRGEWAAGLGGNSVKASSEHWLVMDHILNAPWMPPLVEVKFDAAGNALNVGDFGTRMKDDGKILFMWGNMNKKPTELRLYTTLPVPDAWKQPGANYKVTSARLLVTHLISNSPNDQLRPEDFENESATGILPRYTVCPTAPAAAPQACAGLPEGTWVSAVDSTEGDGDFIPAGTVLRNITPIIFDKDGDGIPEYVDYKTNAWYTTLDRDPFGGPNPRWRLKSSKYGQDLPGVELPQYERDTLTTTSLDLLSMKDAQGNSILSQSVNWYRYLDINPEKDDFVQDNFTADGCPLTPDFDLMVYIKGEYSGNEIYDAQLLVTYDDPNNQAPPQAVVPDVKIDSIQLPPVTGGKSGEITVMLHNEVAGAVSGLLTVEVADLAGVRLDSYSTSFATDAAGGPSLLSFDWTAPSYQTTVTATAVANGVKDETNLANNSASTTLVIKQLKLSGKK